MDRYFSSPGVLGQDEARNIICSQLPVGTEHQTKKLWLDPAVASGVGEWQNRSSPCEKMCLAAMWIVTGLCGAVPNGVQVTLAR